MGSSKNMARDKKRRECKHARAKRGKIVSEEESRDLKSEAIVNCGEINVTVRKKDTGEGNSGCIMSKKKRMRKGHTEDRKKNFDLVDGRRTPISNPRLDGRANNSAAKITSGGSNGHDVCKPCSVVLIRLSSDELTNISKVEKVSVSKQRRNFRSFHWNYQRYLRNQRAKYRERLMKNKGLEKLEGIFAKEERANNGEGRSENSGKKTKGKNKFGANNSGSRIIRLGSRRSLEKLGSENSEEIGIAKSVIFQNSVAPASTEKRFSLSLKKEKSSTQDACRKISLNEDKSKGDEIGSQKSKKITKNSKESKIAESVLLQNSLTPVSTPKRFKLSLKKNESNTQDVCGKISLAEEKIKDDKTSSQKSEKDLFKREKIRSLRKRNRSNARNDEVVEPKRRRCRIKVNPTNEHGEELNTFVPIADGLIPPQQVNNVKIVASPEARTDENLKASVNSIIKDESPITKNLRVSIAKLSNSSDTPEVDEESNVKPLNCLMTSCARTCIYQRKISRITPANAVANDRNKSKNKKITDYFMKIDKKSILPKDNIGSSDQLERDLALKKKYGIIKNAVVSLVDRKEYKFHDMSKYLASEIEKLTYQNTGSSSTLNISVQPKSSPPSSPTTSNHLSSAAPTEFPCVVDNCAKDLSQEFLQTRQSPRIEICTPTKNRADSSNEVSTENSVALESEIGKGSSNCENDLQDYSSVEKTPTKQIDSQIEGKRSSELYPMLHSMLNNDNEPGDSSNVHRTINVTPKTLRSGRKRGSSISPRKRRGLIVSEIEINLESDDSCVEKKVNGDKKILEEDLPSTQSQTSESCSKLCFLSSNDDESGNHSLVSSTNNDSNGKRSALSLMRKCERLIIDETEPSESQICGTEISNAESEKVGKEDDDASVVDKRLNMDPALPSVGKTPLEIAREKSESLKLLNRRLPLNTMTCLNFGVIDEHGSCLALNEIINDVTETDRAKNKEIIIPECNEEKLVCKKTPTKGIENKLLAKMDSSKAEPSVILKNKESDSGKSITLNEPVSTTVKNCTSNENVSMTVNKKAVTEKVVNDKKRKVLKTRGDKPSTSDVLILKKTMVIEAYDKAVPVVFVNDRLGKSTSSENPPTDPLQQEFIGKSEVNADASTEEKDVIPEKLSASSSPSDATAQVDEACENSERISYKECVMCKEKFGQIEDLKKHLHVHIKDTSSCILCDKSLTKENMMEHYLEHCSCVEDDSTFHECNFCNRKFRKLSGMKHHLKSKHKINNKLYRTRLVDKQSNQCSICLKNFNSRDELSAHVYSHNGKELQNAYEIAKANQSATTTPKAPAPQEKSTETPIEENAKEPEKTSPKPTTSSDTPDTLPAATSSNCAVSTCMCHKDERLQISGSVIIEVGLTCGQCKTFYKTRRCFKDHYNNGSCKWSETTVVIPAMFCNKCCVILNSLQEMHNHLKQHTKSTSKTKSSFLCKLCNIYFYGIGSLFYAHWFNHCDNPLFVADHSSFPVNFKVKIVEPEPVEPPNKDELTENLFVAEYQCLECQEPFETEEDLKKHMIVSHSCVKKVDSRQKAIVNPKPLFKLICSICNKEFSDKPAFDVHVEEHDAIINFLKVPKLLLESLNNDQRNCAICDTEYETANIYKEHITRHDIIREKFVCNYCSLMVDSVEKFGKHSLEHKGTPEKPVACKVIFATAKFHCKPCKIWFDDQTALDQHSTIHNKRATSSQKSAESLPANSVDLSTGKKNIDCVTSNQELSHQVDVVNSTPTQEKDNSVASVKLNRALLQISDDSNSSEVEIIAPNKPTEQKEESSVENRSVEGKKESPIKKKDKPAFLRVKNLKELLPYSCSTCKMEFDTQSKLTNHICSKHDTPAQDPNFKYTCTICKNFKCNNDSDWNLHVLSHFPLSSTPRFNNSWFNVLSIQSDKPILKCNICAKYGCVSVSMMRDHFINHHPAIYRPIYKCRVCREFKTPAEHIIRRHEAAHFRTQSGTTPPPLIPTEKNSTSVQSITDPNNSQNIVTNPPVSNVYPPNYQPSISTTRSSTSNSHQPDVVQPFINFADNLKEFQQSNDTNNIQRTALVPSASGLGNNLTTVKRALPPYQPVENFNSTQQQSVLVAVGNNSVNNSLAFTSVNNSDNFQQQNVAAPVKNNLINDMSSGRMVKAIQWVPPTMQVLPNQVLTNNDPPFNNVTNVIENTAPSQSMTNPMYYSCSKCPNFKSTCEQQLKAHESLHEFIRLDKPVQKKYSCKICPDFVCTNAEEFNAHFLTVHKSNKQINLPQLQPKPDSGDTRVLFRCKHCPQTFLSSPSLAEHIYKSHTYFIVSQPGARESENMYPYACHSCTIRFSTESYLNAHIKEAHPDGKLSCIQNLFRCDICQLYLTSQTALECHIKSHNMLYQ